MLQYQVECFVAGVSDCPSTYAGSLADKRALLQLWRDAWRGGFWKIKSDMAFDGTVADKYCAYGPVLASISFDTGAIEFHLVPSSLRSIHERKWRVDGLPTSNSFAYDYDQELLVATQR